MMRKSMPRNRCGVIAVFPLSLTNRNVFAWTPLGRRQGWDFGNLFRQLTLGSVEVMLPLQVEPQIRAIAEELAKPESHGGCHRLPFGQDVVKSLPGHAEQRCDF